MQKFSYIIAGVTALLFVVGYGLYSTVLADSYIDALPILLFAVALVTLAAHYLTLRAAKQQKQVHFNSIFMSTTVGKLMFYLAGIVIYVVFVPETAKVFLVNFLIVYFIYTGVELVAIMSHLKRIRSSKN